MPKKEVGLEYLQQHLPADTAEPVFDYLKKYRVHLTITRERASLLGDYRHRTDIKNHRISVNGTLNKFSFLITLLHELAHLVTFELHGNRVLSHGREWKLVYGKILEEFILRRVFPADIENELKLSLKNPAASSCAEEGLLRVLRKYDERKNGNKLVEEIPLNALFKTKDGRVFRKGDQLRKRYKCKEVGTGRDYLFSPVYEVVPV
jgi:predicted SprT family Zn-dependent metalloprotease